jgi:cyclopropane-fatty-acyl-phospholipid synthase
MTDVDATADVSLHLEAAGKYMGASKAAIAHHYDVGNDFMRLWLDPSMTYSCALWSDGDDLARAQLRKLDYMLDHAGVTDGGRVLDVGCGWGSLLRRAVGRGVASSVGLTLSEAQRDWIEGWESPSIEVHLQGWSTYESDEPFDAIVSIGAFEHFAQPGLARSERVASYRRFFEHCHGLLRPGGRLSLQTIAKGGVPVDRQSMRDVMRIVEMFPESDPPHPADVVAAAEGHFEIASVRNDRLDYARTCRAWLQALSARHEEAAAIGGERIVAIYLRYLEACIRHFQRGHLVLLRIAMERLDLAPHRQTSIATAFSRVTP